MSPKKRVGRKGVEMTISYYDKHYNKYQEVRNHLRSQGFKCLEEIRGVKKVSEVWGKDSSSNATIQITYPKTNDESYVTFLYHPKAFPSELRSSELYSRDTRIEQLMREYERFDKMVSVLESSEE